MTILIKNRIVVLRAERGWSQNDLAQKVGVTRQSIAAIEKGKYSLSLLLAYQIADTFNVKLEDVFQYDYKHDI